MRNDKEKVTSYGCPARKLGSCHGGFSGPLNQFKGMEKRLT